MVIPSKPISRISYAICSENAFHKQICECPSGPLSNCDNSIICKFTREGVEVSMGSTRDVAAAAKIGKLLGERLLVKDIPAVSVHLKREQKYHGKVKAVIDSLRDVGVKLI